MPVTTTRQRLSPKVRRLLEHHDLTARSIPGSGTGGRVTPRDVLTAAGVPRAGREGAIQASPAARQLLRRAGIDPAEIPSDGEPVTRARAARLIDETSTAPVPASPLARRSPSETAVDVAGLLAHLRAAEPALVARDGAAPRPVVAVAATLAGLLTTRSGPWRADDHRGAATVDVGLAHADGGGVVVVEDAAVLTVPGLARRARAAAAEDATGRTPTVVVAEEGAVDAALATGSTVGTLVVGPISSRQVEATDELGLPLVRTRPHVTLRLHPGDAVPADVADDLLDTLAAAVAAWERPVSL